MKRAVKKLKGKQLYDVMCAMRGPDLFESTISMELKLLCSVLKRQYTGRLRYIIFNDRLLDSSGAVVTSRPVSPNDILEVKHLLTVLSRNGESFYPLNHFLNHLQMAVEATIHNPIWGRSAVDMISILSTAKRNGKVDV